MLKPVYFLRAHSLYNSGEVAGFPEAEAAELIAKGIARAHRSYATLEELEAEELVAGCKGKAAKSKAQARFDGKHGEEARYLAPEKGAEVERDADEEPEAEAAEPVAEQSPEPVVELPEAPVEG